MTVDSLGRQSASAALAKLDGENGRSARPGSHLEHNAFQGSFGVFEMLSGEASLDSHTEPQPDRAESSRSELDLSWNSLENAPDNQLLSGLYDIIEDFENVPRSDLLLEADTHCTEWSSGAFIRSFGYYPQ